MTALPLSARLQTLANPKRFLDLSRILLPWIGGAAALLIGTGLYLAFTTPPDYQQGETVKIMFVHVPAAWLGMFVYGVIFTASLTGLIFKHPLADLSAKAAAPLGAAFTALALLTGSLWGKPMWGTYWVWDARLTSELILLFIYLGYIALWDAIEDQNRAAKAASVLALVGAPNLVIIHYSVEWWNTLHQPASLLREGGSGIHAAFLTPLLLMGLGYTVLFFWVWFIRIRTEIFRRRARALMLARGA